MIEDILHEEDQHPEETKWKKFLKMIKSWWIQFSRFSNLKIDYDPEETIKRIASSIDFSGANIWILAFSIIIASVGLNVNSTAVIIGAMLISPLMGPIMGIGLSVGINDGEMLNRSLKNFLYMVVISLLASTLYFFLSPISDAQSELLARTHPTIYDVLIAFFGGMAGIVANSRKGEKLTIISGVAIATALMPPLCTAGFGLATGQLKYFGGAFYLFFINSFFIALATFIMSIYLKLPQVNLYEVHQSKKRNRFVVIFAIIVTIPSVIMSISMIKESRFNSNAIHFVQDIHNNALLKNVEILNTKKEYHHDKSIIELTLAGKTLSDNQIQHLKDKMPAFGLRNTELVIHQLFEDDVRLTGEFAEELYLRNQKLLEEIDGYKNEINRLNQTIIDNEQIAKELSVQFDNLESYAVNRSIFTNINNLAVDTIPTLNAVWKQKPTEKEIQQLKKFVQVRLNIDNLNMVNTQKEVAKK